MRAVSMERGKAGPAFGLGAICREQSGAGPSAHSKASAVPCPIPALPGPRGFTPQNPVPPVHPVSEATVLRQFVAPMNSLSLSPPSHLAFPVHRPVLRKPCGGGRPGEGGRPCGGGGCLPHLSPAGQTGQTRSNHFLTLTMPITPPLHHSTTPSGLRGSHISRFKTTARFSLRFHLISLNFNQFHLVSPNFASRPPGGTPMHPTTLILKFADSSHFAFCLLPSAFSAPAAPPHLLFCILPFAFNIPRT